VNVNVF